VSGNWGCGVFGGDVQVKIIIQWIAATMAGKQLRYCPYGSKDKVYNHTLLTKLSKLKLEDVLKLLLKSASTYNQQLNAKQYNLRSPKRQPTLYSIILQYLS
jgi:poly(ADP-ribose) glycohydrolase